MTARSLRVAKGEDTAEVARLRQALAEATKAAERETDALFAQYQFSQLVAMGETPTELAQSVLAELARLCGADRALCWLGELEGKKLSVVARSGQGMLGPLTIEEEADVSRLLGAEGTWSVVPLRDPMGLVGVIAIGSAAGRLDPDGVRVAELARHQLAVAVRNAQLRSAIDTERQAIAAILESAADAIVEVARDGSVVRTNRAAQALVGITGEASTGLPCASLFGCLAQQGHGEGSCPLIDSATTGMPIDYLELTVSGAGGSPVRLAGSVAPIRRPGNEVTGALAILRDTESRARLEDLRGSFAATVSHEIRTPLALIRGYAESLQKLDLDPGERDRYAHRIEAAVDRITTMVARILEIARADEEPMGVHARLVDARDLVQQIDPALMERWNVRIDIEPAPEGTWSTMVDAERLDQVMYNLLENAAKYGPAHAPIVVGARSAGDRVEIFVEDEGAGVPPEERETLTLRFRRGGRPPGARPPGYGLGLHVARTIVEAHGGTLRIGPRPDGASGTRVAFTLPTVQRSGVRIGDG